MPWQGWPQQHVDNYPWKQGWKGYGYGNIPTYTYSTPSQSSYPMSPPH
jgi:hypothetical protein